MDFHLLPIQILLLSLRQRNFEKKQQMNVGVQLIKLNYQLEKTNKRNTKETHQKRPENF
jgi:hypothetical protein